MALFVRVIRLRKKANQLRERMVKSITRQVARRRQCYKEVCEFPSRMGLFDAEPRVIRRGRPKFAQRLLGHQEGTNSGHGASSASNAFASASPILGLTRESLQANAFSGILRYRWPSFSGSGSRPPAILTWRAASIRLGNGRSRSR